MSNLLQELGTPGVLLLYLADELSPEDRAEVDRLLVGDPAVRAELDSLRESQALMDSRLAALDAVTPLASDEAAAVRNVSRMIRQRQARPPVAASAGATDAGRRTLPRWAYPAAVAAAVAVVAGVTWRALGPDSPDRVVRQDSSEEVDVQPVQLEWEDHVVKTLSREVADVPLGEGQEVASAGYDQPLFDIPFSLPQEGGQPEP